MPAVIAAVFGTAVQSMTAGGLSPCGVGLSRCAPLFVSPLHG